MATSSLDKLKLSGTRLGVFAATLWIVFIADRILPGDFNRWGIIPRHLDGIWGILFSPFLHANLGHLLSNFLPVMLLLALLLATQPNAWSTVLQIVLLGGILLWIFGRPAVHVGASGLIYGLIAYLMAAGVSTRPIRTRIGRSARWFPLRRYPPLRRPADGRPSRLLGRAPDERHRTHYSAIFLHQKPIRSANSLVRIQPIRIYLLHQNRYISPSTHYP